MKNIDTLNKAKAFIIRRKFFTSPDIFDFLNGRDNKILICNDMKYLYYDWHLNWHHYTTEYHRNVIIPVLSELLGFEYSVDDYDIVERHCGKYDISALRPKANMEFNVKSLEFGIEFDCGFDGLSLDCNKYGIDGWTEYHGLYVFPHSCSIVKNKNNGNGRKLLVSGDSQMIPTIPFLCSIYSEVWYMDNRCGKSFSDLLDAQDFDDVLIQIFESPLSYYIDNNLK